MCCSPSHLSYAREAEEGRQSHRCCSSSLQGDYPFGSAFPDTVLPTVVRSFHPNVQTCKPDHPVGLSQNASVPTTSQTPPAQLSQHNFAAQTPPREAHNPFSMAGKGQANPILHHNLLSTHLTHPTTAALEQKGKC